MPIYEFYCNKCNLDFEELLPINHPGFKCENCGTEAIKKVSQFCGVVPGSSNRTLDQCIGDDANKKWEKIYSNKDSREQHVKKLVASGG